MAVNRDFKDLFAEFNAGRVRYLLVGGYAMAVYGLPRFTKDLDLWVEPTLANAKRVIAALTAFGARLFGLDPVSLVHADLMCQIGVAPNRIDVITRIDGVGLIRFGGHQRSGQNGVQSNRASQEEGVRVGASRTSSRPVLSV